jgi:hypothetical protein
MIRATQKVRTICPTCAYTYEDDYVDKFTTTKCPNCLRIFGIDENGKPIRNKPFYKRFKDVVGFGKDPQTGLEVGVTTGGKRVSLDETRYDFKKDPHGWQATGKKVKGKQRK